MFCIYQLDEVSNESIVDLIESKDDFLPKILEFIKSKYGVKSLDGIQFDDIKNNMCFTNGHYLLNNENVIELVWKQEVVNKGLIYSTCHTEIKKLFTWKCLPLLNKNIKIAGPESYVNLDSDSNPITERRNALVDMSDLTFGDSDSDSPANSFKLQYTEELKESPIFESVNTKVDNNLTEEYEKPLKKKIFRVEANKVCTEDFIDSTKKSKLMLSDVYSEKYSDKLNDEYYDLSTFDMDSMCINPSIVIIGKRGSGKSWTVRNILDKLINDQFNPVKDVLIISPTERMSSFYEPEYPKAKVLYEYDSKEIVKFLENRRTSRNKGCVLLDCCLATKSQIFNNPELLELFYNARHYNTSFIYCEQFPSALKPELRCNFDYIFLAGEDFYSNQKRIYDYYAGMFPTFETFRNYFTEATKNFGFMVINNRGSNISLQSKVSKFKANSSYKN